MLFRHRGPALLPALLMFLLVLGGGLVAAPAAHAQTAVPLYRLLNEPNRFLTANADEFSSLVASGWANEGNVGYVYQASTDVPNLVPLFRLLNPYNTNHLYTTSVAERDAAVAGGLVYEGVAGYVFTAAGTGRQPLFRAHNDYTYNHFFTNNESEYNGLGAGWTKEGIAAYVATSSGSNTYNASLRGSNETPANGSTASGTATIVLAPDQQSARVSFNFSGFASTAAHIHGPADPGVAGGIIFDLPLGNAHRDILWPIDSRPGLTKQQQVDALKAGRLYVNVHSATFPAGEIRGNLFQVNAAPPGPPPTPGPDIPNIPDAVRFLEQATFGPNKAGIERLTQYGITSWMNEQFALPASKYDLMRRNTANLDDINSIRYEFYKNALAGDDQLRQRIVFALHQILVVSAVELSSDLPALQTYYTVLNQHAFGNYKDLLRTMTLDPAMGRFLNMVNNAKGNPTTGTLPNENYARELLQLFSIGVYMLNSDGSVQLDGSGIPIETYGNNEIKAFARALTGWTYANADGSAPSGGRNSTIRYGVYAEPRSGSATDTTDLFTRRPLVADPRALASNDHDSAAKTLLNYPGVNAANRDLPAGRTAVQDLDSVIDNVFNHPNVGPFVCSQLIRKMVTSNPSSGYIQRVVARFNDSNGSAAGGVRGDMKAVIQAILTDGEARGDNKPDANYGRLREPIQFVTNVLRAMNAVGSGTTPYSGVSGFASSMGQSIFNSPTVFNYYLPDFQVNYQGTTLFSPESQTLTTETSVRRVNFINSVVYGATTAIGGVTTNITEWEPFATNTTTLVDKLNERLMHNALSADAKSRIVSAVNTVPTGSTQMRDRVRMAMYLIFSSIQYQVQQ